MQKELQNSKLLVSVSIVASGLFKPQRVHQLRQDPASTLAAETGRQTTAELVFVDPPHRRMLSNPR